MKQLNGAETCVHGIQKATQIRLQANVSFRSEKLLADRTKQISFGFYDFCTTDI
jgi:hypothetical protein